MSITNLGDLSHSFTSRQRNVSLREEIGRLSEELATGQVADVRSILAGNYSTLTDIERRTEILDGYNVATTEATIFAGSAQNALANFQEFGANFSNSLLIAGTSAVGSIAADTVGEALSTLTGMVGAMNSSVAGRYLFSGTATDLPPLPDVDTILAEVRTVIAGAATPDDVLAAADAWFDDPAGFEAVLYQGSANRIGPFALSQTETVDLDVRAVDPNLRDFIKLTAVAALGDDPVLGFDVATQSELFDKIGQAMLGAQVDVIATRAKIGFAEARIDGIAARNAAELTSLGFFKSDLLEADPFETATKLEEAQFQLESLYSVTVRMSRLSLANYL